VFPGAGHGLFVAAPDPSIDRASQLAPGFVPMVEAFIHRNASAMGTEISTKSSTDPSG
jgi:hypothetical protein